MVTNHDLTALKSRVSAAVLKLPGVAGVGLPERGLTVYLESDAPEVRERVAAAVSELKLPVEVHWELTGKFGTF